MFRSRCLRPVYLERFAKSLPLETVSIEPAVRKIWEGLFLAPALWGFLVPSTINSVPGHGSCTLSQLCREIILVANRRVFFFNARVPTQLVRFSWCCEVFSIAERLVEVFLYSVDLHSKFSFSFRHFGLVTNIGVDIWSQSSLYHIICVYVLGNFLNTMSCFIFFPTPPATYFFFWNSISFYKIV